MTDSKHPNTEMQFEQVEFFGSVHKILPVKWQTAHALIGLSQGAHSDMKMKFCVMVLVLKWWNH